MEAQRTAKQTYLREEVIDKGYSPEAFLEFCNSKKPGGIDVDQWTVNELQELVTDFKTLHQPQRHQQYQQEEEVVELEQHSPVQEASSQEEPIQEQQQELRKEPLHDPLTSHQQVAVEEKVKQQEPLPIVAPEDKMAMRLLDDDWEYQQQVLNWRVAAGHKSIPYLSHVYAVGCQTCEQTALNFTQKVRVVVLEPTVVQGNFFTPSYVVFQVNTEPMQWSVQRKAADFEWLATVLHASYPALIIPPLPPKRYRGFDIEFLLKRQRFLQRFLTWCLNIPECSRNPQLEAFLQLASAEFEKFKKKKVKKPEAVQEQWTATGMAPVAFDSNELAIVNQMNDYMLNNENLRRKAKGQLQELMGALQAIKSNFDELSNQLGLLEQLEMRYQSLAPQHFLYSSLKNTFTALATNLNYQAFNLLELISYLSFSYRHSAAFRDLMRERESSRVKFEKAFRELEAKKERLWKEGDLKKFQVDIKTVGHMELLDDKDKAIRYMQPSDTAKVKDLKIKLGFLNAQLLSEFGRVYEMSCIADGEQCIDFSMAQSSQMAQMHTTWDSLLALFNK